MEIDKELEDQIALELNRHVGKTVYLVCAGAILYGKVAKVADDARLAVLMNRGKESCVVLKHILAISECNPLADR